ncbi:unnamed protein product [Rhizophagus irregularis]|nr:unnamed protein product [Rhizophagus irregularis]
MGGHDSKSLFKYSDGNYELEISEKSEAVQIISFNLTIKSSTDPTLPSKWVEIEASSLDDILACVHQYVVILTGDKEIMHSDYLEISDSEESNDARKRKNAVPKVDDFSTYKAYCNAFSMIRGTTDNTQVEWRLLRFKSTFVDEQITVDQICDLTDAEFDQLGINKNWMA